MPAQLPPDRIAKWEKEVAGIEARLGRGKPPAGGVCFAGSSSIRLWDLAKSFPGRPAVNVGFGGSEVRDCSHFAARLVVPLKPVQVVLYAGDNDLQSGRSPQQVADDVAAFRKAVTGVPVVVIAVKPSPKRWELFAKQREANRLVQAADPAGFVDVVPAMLGADGKPKPELFVADGLHLSAAGYQVWAELVGAAVRWPGGRQAVLSQARARAAVG